MLWREKRKYEMHLNICNKLESNRATFQTLAPKQHETRRFINPACQVKADGARSNACEPFILPNKRGRGPMHDLT